MKSDTGSLFFRLIQPPGQDIGNLFPFSFRLLNLPLLSSFGPFAQNGTIWSSTGPDAGPEFLLHSKMGNPGSERAAPDKPAVFGGIPVREEEVTRYAREREMYVNVFFFF